MPEHFFSQLFKITEEITPYLNGEFGEISRDAIHIDNDINPIIQELYTQLSKQYPEAGNAYWLTRTWDLLCWQPVSVAVLSIYHFQSLPNIFGMAQYVQPCFVTGYRFSDDLVTQGDHKALISLAGKQIKSLFDYYQNQMSDWVRIRPGFTHQLMADGILACLLRLQQYSPQLSNELIREHAALWLQALELDVNNSGSLYEVSTTQPIKLVRKSCCHVHKCTGRKFCDDCPKLTNNRQIIAKRRDARKY